MIDETRTRAERRARRRNNRTARELPLFAATGTIGPFQTTPEREIPAIERADRRFEAQQLRLRELAIRQHYEAVMLRALVARVVGPERLAELDRRRMALPLDPVYEIDHWRTEHRRLIGGPDAALPGAVA